MKVLKPIARTILSKTPFLLFPRWNAALFRMLGYKVDYTARIFSSVQILGKISVEIGARSFVGHETLIAGGMASIKIGSDCDISDRVMIICGTHEITRAGPRAAGTGCGKDIIIDNGVWIGFGAHILPGVHIGEHAIVGAGSVVTKNVRPFVIVAGNPARELRELSIS
jgi:maltose O-acetyltransferase